MSDASSKRAEFSDSPGIIFIVLTPDSAIVTSRKRKLRELFAVATHVDALPQDVSANPDAPSATAAEWQFLQLNDILQYVLPTPPPILFCILRAVLRCVCAVSFDAFCPRPGRWCF